MHPSLEALPSPRRPGACETRLGGHLIEKPKRWPPKFRMPQSRRPPSVSLSCLNCEAHVIVYDPPQEGVRFATDKEVKEIRERDAAREAERAAFAEEPGAAEA